MTARAIAGVVFAALMASLAGCELVTGIVDKTLASDGGGGIGVGVPCAKQGSYLFCDDFDSEATFGETWDWHSTQTGGAEAFDTTDFASAPRSARFTGTASAVTSAQLGKQGVTLGSSLRLAFDLRLDVDDASKLPEVAIAQVLTTTSALSINYVVGPGAQASLQIFDLNGGAGPVTTVMLPFPALRTWTNLVITTDWQTVGFEEDGRSLASSKPPRQGSPGAVKMIAGIVYVNPAPGATTAALELDDVVLGGS